MCVQESPVPILVLFTKGANYFLYFYCFVTFLCFFQENSIKCMSTFLHMSLLNMARHCIEYSLKRSDDPWTLYRVFS